MSEPTNGYAKREYQVEQQLGIQENVLDQLEKTVEELKQRLSGVLRDEPEVCSNSDKTKEALVSVAEKTRYHNSRITTVIKNIRYIIELCEL